MIAHFHAHFYMTSKRSLFSIYFRVKSEHISQMSTVTEAPAPDALTAASPVKDDGATNSDAEKPMRIAKCTRIDLHGSLSARVLPNSKTLEVVSSDGIIEVDEDVKTNRLVLSQRQSSTDVHYDSEGIVLENCTVNGRVVGRRGARFAPYGIVGNVVTNCTVNNVGGIHHAVVGNGNVFRGNVSFGNVSRGAPSRAPIECRRLFVFDQPLVRICTSGTSSFQDDIHDLTSLVYAEQDVRADASGSSLIQLPRMACEQLRIKASGASSVTVDALEHRANIEVSGASRVQICVADVAKSIEAEVSGASVLQCPSPAVDSVELSGGARLLRC